MKPVSSQNTKSAITLSLRTRPSIEPMRACAVGDSPRRLSFAPPHRVAAYPLGKARADSPAAKSGEFASLSHEGDFICEWHFFLKRVVRAAVVRISQIARIGEKSRAGRFNASRIDPCAHDREKQNRRQCEDVPDWHGRTENAP